MMKISRSPRIAFAAVGVVVVIAVSLVVVRNIDLVLASTRYQITAEKVQTNAGSYSFIETSNPSVPNDWSYNRIASTSGSKFVEVGWIKEDGHSEDPSVFWTSYDGVNPQEWGRIPANLSKGTSYNYHVKHDTGDNWDIYFNELNVVHRTVDINTSSTTAVMVGAEVINVNDDIGDSEDTGATYRSTSDGNFYALCNMDPDNDWEPNYSIEDLAGCGNWRFYDD